MFTVHIIFDVWLTYGYMLNDHKINQNIQRFDQI